MDATLPPGKRLVIIEDEEILLQILKKKLTALGHDVQTATDGVTGLALITETKPDMVLLDMNLPKMDGFQILEEIKRLGIIPKLPVLIISNSGQPVEVTRAMSLGIRDYIVKVNFEPDEVIEKVLRILDTEGKPAPAGPQPGAEATDKTATQPDRNGITGSRILLVEDDLFILQLLNDKLRRSGCTTFVASDAETALTLLKENPVDLILLDIVLPGMDGFTFLQQLKTYDQYKNIPIMFLSNLGQKEEIERGLKMGAVDYIIKANNSPSEIIDRIEKVLRKRT